MQVWNGIERFPTGHPPVCASIGNYDGVHRAHQAILGRCVERARAEGIASLLVTFEPHPLSIVAPERRPLLLETRRQHLRSLQRVGLDGVLIVEFTEGLARLEGRAFFDRVLLPAVTFRSIHVGGNFRFGHQRSGDTALLRSIAEAHAFDVETVPPVEIDEIVVSSTEIRRRVAAGDVSSASLLLGRPYALEGVVVRGDGRGRSLGFPTANVSVHNELVPRPGVYVTVASLPDGRRPSVTNIGVRPTFGGDARPVVETHVLEFEGDLYGRRVEIEFAARLRDEMRFDGPTALSDQIARDLAATESYFASQGIGGDR